jgi:aspartate aminotransferase-like enzyme
LASGINVVQDGIRIGLMGGSKDADLEELVGFLQALEKVGTQVEAGLNHERWKLTLTISSSSGKKIDRTKSGRSA